MGYVVEGEGGVDCNSRRADQSILSRTNVQNEVGVIITSGQLRKSRKNTHFQRKITSAISGDAPSISGAKKQEAEIMI